MGPHSEELYFNYLVNFKGMKFEIDFSDAKRGELTDEMLYNQYHDNEPNYKRFSNEVESITNLHLWLKKNLQMEYQLT